MTKWYERLQKDNQERLSLEKKIISLLSEDIRGLEIVKIRVSPSGCILIEYDIKEKSHSMGELGFYKIAYDDFTSHDSTEKLFESIKTGTKEAYQKMLKEWKEVKEIFINKFPSVKNRPKRRSKAYELLRIYETLGYYMD